jgi:hypothetical protein
VAQVSTFYYLSADNSDLSGGADFSKKLVESGPSSGTQTLSFSGSQAKTSYGFTEPTLPGADGVTGDYEIIVSFPTTNAQGRLAISLSRVNSAGTVQSTSSSTAEQTTGASSRTFNLTGVNLGTWASGDRLRVNFEFRNNSNMNQSWAIDFGANTSVETPWSNATNATATATGVESSSEIEAVSASGSALQEITGAELEITASTISAESPTAEILFDDGAGDFDDAFGLFDDGGLKDGLIVLDGVESLSSAATIAASGSAIVSVTGEFAQSAAQDIFASGSGLADVNGAESESAAEPISGSGTALANVSGAQAESAAATITAEGQVFATASVTGVEAQSTAAQVDARGTTSNVALVHGTQATAFAQTITASGDSVADVTGVEVQSESGEVGAAGSGVVIVNGAESTATYQQITGSGNALAQVEGAEAQSQVAEITAEEQSGQDGTATVTGVEATITAGVVKAKQKTTPSYKPRGEMMLRPMRAVDGRARTVTAYGYAIPANIRAVGLTVINGGAAISSVQSAAEIEQVSAFGVLDIDETDLLLLLAA